MKRVVTLIFSLFAVSTLGFFLTRFAPGNPFSGEDLINEVIIRNLEQKYGLDKTIYEQYFSYMTNLFYWDFGLSMSYQDLFVKEIIKESLPVSLILGLSALCVAVIGGSLLGSISALKKGSWIDHFCSGFAIIGLSLPLFVIAPLLVFIFSMKLKFLPSSGWITDMGLKSIIIPVISLSFPYLAAITRIMRTSTIGVLKSDYIRTAKAMGLPSHIILIKHVFRGAFLPIVSYLGPMLANLITGSLVIEQIFRIPGLARPFVNSSLNRDYPLILGCVLTYAVLLMISNILVDIAYTFLDPRISVL